MPAIIVPTLFPFYKHGSGGQFVISRGVERTERGTCVFLRVGVNGGRWLHGGMVPEWTDPLLSLGGWGVFSLWADSKGIVKTPPPPDFWQFSMRRGQPNTSQASSCNQTNLLKGAGAPLPSLA